MRKLSFAVVASLLLAMPAYGYVEFDSGEYEPVDYSIGDTISIDDNVPNNPGTHIELLPYGHIQGAVYSYNKARFTLNGGSVYGRLMMHDDSVASIKAGSLAYSDGKIFFMYENSLATIYGSSFSVNGTPVACGESLRDYAVYNGTFYTGELDGTLLDGTGISGDFFIYSNADITVVPEPVTSTLLISAMLGLSGLALVRRRR